MKFLFPFLDVSIVLSLTLNSQPTANTSLKEAYLILVFSLEAQHSLLALRTTRQHFSTPFEGPLKTMNLQPKAQTYKNRGTKETRERTLSHSMIADSRTVPLDPRKEGDSYMHICMFSF